MEKAFSQECIATRLQAIIEPQKISLRTKHISLVKNIVET
jgi:hypothetical protein